MAPISIRYYEGDAAAKRQPRVLMVLRDGKREWTLLAHAEFDTPQEELLAEMLAAGVAEFRRRITAECGADHAEALLGKVAA